jgi:hypothetical protein
MTPVKLDLKIYKGSTYRKGFQWKIQSTNAPMNLVGCSIKMQVKACRGDTAVLLECSTSNGKILLTDAINGKWQITLSPSDTAALTFTKAVYDLDITFPSTDVFTPIEGVISCTSQVTT